MGVFPRVFWQRGGRARLGPGDEPTNRDIWVFYLGENTLIAENLVFYDT